MSQSSPEPGDRLGQDDDQVRAAARFAVGAAAGGVAFLILAALWASRCNDQETATVACGGPQRMLLALGTPVIWLLGGLWAFGRTYQVWRDRGAWWGWHGAGWFLLSLMMLALTLGMPPIAGPALGG